MTNQETEFAPMPKLTTNAEYDQQIAQQAVSTKAAPESEFAPMPKLPTNTEYNQLLAKQANEPVAQTPPEPKSLLRQAGEFITNDIPELAKSGLDTSQANIQRSITNTGLVDLSRAEQANRDLAEREGNRVSPETQKAMQDFTYSNERGFENPSVRGIGGHVAQSILNAPSMAGIVGGAMQFVPNPLVKAAGLGLSSAANALDIGGGAAQSVEQQGGDLAAQRQANIRGGILGAVTGLAEPLVLSKTLAPDAGGILRRVATGAVGEALQEYPEEAGQAVVENQALGRPWDQGAHERGMLGAGIGAISGGLFGTAGAVGNNARLNVPQAPPGTRLPENQVDTSGFNNPERTPDDIEFDSKPASNTAAKVAPTVTSPTTLDPAAVTSTTANSTTPKVETNVDKVNEALANTEDKSAIQQNPVAKAAKSKKVDPLDFITQNQATLPKIDNPVLPAITPVETKQNADVASKALNEAIEVTIPTVNPLLKEQTTPAPLLKEQPAPTPVVDEGNDQPDIATETDEQADQNDHAQADEAGLDGENGVPYVPVGNVRSDSVYINNNKYGTESSDLKTITQTQKPDKLGNYHVVDHPTSVMDESGNAKDVPIVQNGVAALHRALTNDSGNLKPPTLQSDGTYKIGDQSYSVTRDQGNLKVEAVSPTGASTHAVTIEKETGVQGRGQYFIKLHKFNSESGESAKRVRVMQAFKKGHKWANTAMNGKGVSRAKNASKLLHFTHPTRLNKNGEPVTVTLTPSSLRSVGSIVNNTDNKSLENQLANFNAGLSAAIARFGRLSFDEGMTLDKIVIADKNQFGEHSLTTHGQATKEVRADVNTISKASHVVKAARKILNTLWGPANAAAEAGKAIENTLAPLKATQKTVSEAKEAIAAYEKGLLRVDKAKLTEQAKTTGEVLIKVVNKLYAKARLTVDKSEQGKIELDILQRLSDNLDNRDTSPDKVIDYLHDIINKNSKIAQNYTGTDEAPEVLAGESKIDNAATQHYDASEEDVAKGNFNTDPRTSPSLGGPSNNPNTNTTKQDTITQGNRSVTNLATHINPKATAFFNGLLKKLRIPQTFTLLDAHGLEKAQIHDDVRAQIALSPFSSQFIAFDTANNMLGHFIYIATKNPDGTNRSRAQQTFDMAHEFGHFVQRNVLDHVVKAASVSGDPAADRLLGSLLGVEAQDGIDSITRYQGMGEIERDIVDEMFANNLADALVREKGALTVDGATFTDVVGSDEATFFPTLAKLLLNAYKAVVTKAQKLTQANVDSFILAMTGRTESIYYDLVESGGRTTSMRPAKRARTQHNMLQVKANLNKMTSNRYVKDAISFSKHFLSTSAELMSMTQDEVKTGASRTLKSVTATTIAREFTAPTLDRGKKDHGQDYANLLHRLNAELALEHDKLLPLLPLGKEPFSANPKGVAMLAELHKYLSMQTPLNKIPANLNFTVERTQDLKNKNVPLNVRDTIRAVREFDNKVLYEFSKKGGAQLKYMPNHWAKVLTRETMLDHEEAIFKALTTPIKQMPVWVTSVDKKTGVETSTLTYVDERARTAVEAKEFIDMIKTGEALEENPFASLTVKKTIDDLFGTLYGSTNDANKARKISEARWQSMYQFTEADPMSVMLQRSHQAAKTRAIEGKFGAWVIPGAGTSFKLMSREEYHGTEAGKYRDGWIAKQRNRLNDAIMTHMGRPDLTKASIDAVEAMGLRYTHLWAERNSIVAGAVDPNNLDPITERPKQLAAAFNERVDTHYYSPVGRLSALIVRGLESGDLKQEDAIRIKQVIIPALLGRLGQKEMGAAWRAGQAYLQTGMNVAFLPLAVTSSLAEPGQIAIRLTDVLLGHSMWESVGKVLTATVKMLFTEQGKIDRAFVNAMNHAQGRTMAYALEHAHTASIEAEYVPMGVKKFNARFFQITQLKRWTDFTRDLAYVLGKDAMRDYIQQARAGVPQAQAQADSLGLDYSGNRPLDAVWENSQEFQTAMSRWMNEATLRPGAETRPARMSDPRFGLIWYLKDFPWAMAARTLSYLMQQSNLQPTTLARMTPWISAAVPMMLAGAMGAFIKDMLVNQAPSALLGIEAKDNYEDSWNVVTGAMKKSGMLGPLEIMWQFTESYEHRGLPWIGAVSPAASLIQDAAIRGAGHSLRDKLPFLSILPKHVRDVILHDIGLKAEE